MFYLSIAEERAFENLVSFLLHKKGFEYGSFIESSIEAYIRAEQKAIMSILLSLDESEYIYDNYSMGTAIKKLVRRLHEFSTLILDSVETKEPLLGTDIFSGEMHYDKEATGLVFACTPNIKLEFLGDFESWAYHCLINGCVHPATREPITHFACKTLIDIAALPKCLKLTRSERNSLMSGILSQRPNSPVLNLFDIEDFEYNYDIPVERSFLELHGDPIALPQQHVHIYILDDDESVAIVN